MAERVNRVQFISTTGIKSVILDQDTWDAAVRRAMSAYWHCYNLNIPEDTGPDLAERMLIAALYPHLNGK